MALLLERRDLRNAHLRQLKRNEFLAAKYRNSGEKEPLTRGLAKAARMLAKLDLLDVSLQPSALESPEAMCWALANAVRQLDKNLEDFADLDQWRAYSRAKLNACRKMINELSRQYWRPVRQTVDHDHTGIHR